MKGNVLRAALPLLSILSTCLCLAREARAQAFAPGDIIVSASNFVGQDRDQLLEFTRAGGLVQSMPVSYVGNSRPLGEDMRGVSVGQDGQAYIYNGTFDPTLTSIDPVQKSTTTYLGATFDSTSTVYAGKVATYSHYAFTTDENTGSTPDHQLNG